MLPRAQLQALSSQGARKQQEVLREADSVKGQGVTDVGANVWFRRCRFWSRAFISRLRMKLPTLIAPQLSRIAEFSYRLCDPVP